MDLCLTLEAHTTLKVMVKQRGLSSLSKAYVRKMEILTWPYKHICSTPLEIGYTPSELLS